MTYQDDLQDDQLHLAMRSAIDVEPAMRSLPSDDLGRGRTKLRHRRIGIAAGAAAAVAAVVLVFAVAPNDLSAGPEPPGVAEQDGSREEPFRLGVLEAAVADALERIGASDWHNVAGTTGSNSDSDAEVSSAIIQAQWAGEGLFASLSLSVSDPSAFPIAEQSDSCNDPGLVDRPELTCEAQELPDGGSVLVGTGEDLGRKRLTVRFERPDGDIVWATVDMNDDSEPGYENSDAPLPELPLTTEQLIELVQDPHVHL